MAQRKETKTKIKVRDLKPKKDAKGGFVLDRAGNNQTIQGRNQNSASRNPTIHI
jgi:hypothetical protein